MRTTIKSLAKTMADHHQMTKAESTAAMKIVFEAIADSAAQGKNILIPGFGTFKVRDIPERRVRIPRSEDIVEIAAHRKLVLIPSKNLKEKLKEKS